MATRLLEPLAWLLFSAGGVMAALLLPVVAVLFGLAFPLGWLAPPSQAHILGLLQPLVVRLGLWTVLTLCLLHWAHRFRYTLYDGLQVKHLNEVINLVCYGGALLGSAVAAWELLKL
jgi:fumarate reductase subunit D